MKRLFYLMLVVLGTMAFVSCSDDDENKNHESDGSITMVTEDENIEFAISTLKEGDEVTIDWGDGTIENFKSVIDKGDNPVGFAIDFEHSYTDGKSNHTIIIQGNGNIDGIYRTTEETYQVTSLDVSKCPTLIYLYWDYCQLTSLDVSKCPNLIELNCGSNQLTSLDVSKNTALTELSCFSNQLTSLDVSKNIALTELSCGGNPLTLLDVSKNTALETLWCSCELTSLDVSKNTALTELNCRNNQLTSLDVSKNTALTELDCRGNQLTSLDVSKNTALMELNCQGNQFTAAEINKIYEALPTVKDGYLYCNQLGNPSIAEQKGWIVH